MSLTFANTLFEIDFHDIIQWFVFFGVLGGLWYRVKQRDKIRDVRTRWETSVEQRVTQLERQDTHHDNRLDKIDSKLDTIVDGVHNIAIDVARVTGQICGRKEN